MQTASNFLLEVDVDTCAMCLTVEMAVLAMMLLFGVSAEINVTETRPNIVVSKFVLLSCAFEAPTSCVQSMPMMLAMESSLILRALFLTSIA